MGFNKIFKILLLFITFLSLEKSTASDIEEDSITNLKPTFKIDQMELTLIPDSLLQLPEGITVEKGLNGYGLFALKDFKAGEIIYDLTTIILPYHEKNRIIPFNFPHLPGNFTHIVKRHAVSLPERETGWVYYGFDSFINHSCLPNSLAITVYNDNHHNDDLTNIATRNIKSGEEITTNYNLCYWDLDYPIYSSESSIIICNCQQFNCIKEIKGFVHLSQETQNALAPFTYSGWARFRKEMDG